MGKPNGWPKPPPKSPLPPTPSLRSKINTLSQQTAANTLANTVIPPPENRTISHLRNRIAGNTGTMGDADTATAKIAPLSPPTYIHRREGSSNEIPPVPRPKLPPGVAAELRAKRDSGYIDLCRLQQLEEERQTVLERQRAREQRKLKAQEEQADYDWLMKDNHSPNPSAVSAYSTAPSSVLIPPHPENFAAPRPAPPIPQESGVEDWFGIDPLHFTRQLKNEAIPKTDDTMSSRYKFSAMSGKLSVTSTKIVTISNDAQVRTVSAASSVYSTQPTENDGASPSKSHGHACTSRVTGDKSDGTRAYGTISGGGKSIPQRGRIPQFTSEPAIEVQPEAVATTTASPHLPPIPSLSPIKLDEGHSAPSTRSARGPRPADIESVLANPKAYMTKANRSGRREWAADLRHFDAQDKKILQDILNTFNINKQAPTSRYDKSKIRAEVVAQGRSDFAFPGQEEKGHGRGNGNDNDKAQAKGHNNKPLGVNVSHLHNHKRNADSGTTMSTLLLTPDTPLGGYLPHPPTFSGAAFRAESRATVHTHGRHGSQASRVSFGHDTKGGPGTPTSPVTSIGPDTTHIQLSRADNLRFQTIREKNLGGVALTPEELAFFRVCYHKELHAAVGNTMKEKRKDDIPNLTPGGAAHEEVQYDSRFSDHASDDAPPPPPKDALLRSKLLPRLKKGRSEHSLKVAAKTATGWVSTVGRSVRRHAPSFSASSRDNREHERAAVMEAAMTQFMAAHPGIPNLTPGYSGAPHGVYMHRNMPSMLSLASPDEISKVLDENLKLQGKVTMLASKVEELLVNDAERKRLAAQESKYEKWCEEPATISEVPIPPVRSEDYGALPRTRRPVAFPSDDQTALDVKAAWKASQSTLSLHTANPYATADTGDGNETDDDVKSAPLYKKLGRLGRRNSVHIRDDWKEQHETRSRRTSAVDSFKSAKSVLSAAGDTVAGAMTGSMRGIDRILGRPQNVKQGSSRRPL